MGFKKSKDQNASCSEPQDEAVRIANIENKQMQKYLDKTINDVAEINKTLKPIWKFTYKISGGEEERPDNLLVSWIRHTG